MSIRAATRSWYEPGGVENVVFYAQEAAPYHWGPSQVLGTIAFSDNRMLFEAITPNSSKDHKRWKAFEHYKCESTYVSRVQNTVMVGCYNGNTSKKLDICRLNNHRAIFGAANVYGPLGQFNNGLTPWYVPRSDGGFIPPPDNLESLKLRGLQAMVPRIKGELAALVSGYEIGDIVSIKGTLKNILKVSKGLFSRLRGLSSNRTLKQSLVHATADGYLQWMFNLKPLISDIGGIYRAVANYERRVNDLIARSGKLQVAHFRCPLNEQLITSFEKQSGETTAYLFVNEGTQRSAGLKLMEREVAVTSAWFNCSMQYNYYYSAFQQEHAKLLGLLDMLGVNLNPRYLWEVIPWSFVVDWVVDIGQWLDQFEVKNLEPKVNILQYCWSIKKQRYVKVRARIRSSISYGSSDCYPPTYVHFPTVVETSYRRGIDLPGSGSFKTSGLSSTELSLGAALLITRRRRNPGRKHI